MAAVAKTVSGHGVSSHFAPRDGIGPPEYATQRKPKWLVDVSTGWAIRAAGR
jgi:hypothetical protein